MDIPDNICGLTSCSQPNGKLILTVLVIFTYHGSFMFGRINEANKQALFTWITFNRIVIDFHLVPGSEFDAHQTLNITSMRIGCFQYNFIVPAEGMEILFIHG